MVTYKKYRHNFFNNIIKNKMTKYYLQIILVFVLLSGFILKSLSANQTAKEGNSDKSEAESVSDELVSRAQSIDSNISRIVVKPTAKSYTIKINTGNQHVYVYDGDALIKCFICSISSSIYELSEDELENITISDKKVWRKNNNNTYSQYSSLLSNNLILESVPYKSADKNQILKEYYNNLGGKVGDKNEIYLMAGDANWIYNNCNKDSIIEFYSDPNEPISEENSKKIKLMWCIGWDPSDTDSENPYSSTKVSSFEGISDKVVQKGSAFNPLDGVKAIDENGNDITSKIVISGTYDTNTYGEYIITYVIADIYEGNQIWDCKITVI